MTRVSRQEFLRLKLTASPPVITAGLAPYTGPWTKQEAGHLLARTTFGAPYGMIVAAVEAGLEGALDRLLEDLPLPEPPKVTTELDGVAAIGETWVDKPYPEGVAAQMASLNSRQRSLYGWLGQSIMQEPMSARETMVLFWHNHFAITNINEPKYAYRYLTTLRSQVFGNFRQLVKDITVDPLMLRFLNGNVNTAAAPNENYARELLELFTIGKGPQVGSGDYTNYTEQDVIAMAKSLTGWRDYGYRSARDGAFGSFFRPNQHDGSTVQLSHRFDDRQLASSGETTYADLVDIILEKEEVSRFLVRKLYRWFVYYEISEQTEVEVIEPLAAIFRDNDYQVKPVLRALLSSEHFYDILSQGPVIKHPLNFTLGLFRSLEIPQVGNPLQLENLNLAVLTFSGQIGMVHLQPPNVAGWKAFYQEPLFYRQWINSATLPLRQAVTQQILSGNTNIRGYGRLDFRLLNIVRQFPEPAALYPMIEEWVSLLFPRPVPQTQLEYLRDVLLPGLPDTQWAVEWSELQANPNDEALEIALEINLRNMVRTIMEMPEFQLS